MPHDKIITTNQNESAYTASIIIEHGKYYDTLEKYRKHFPRFMQERECILVRSDKTDWVGYLPLDEIDITEHHKTPCTSAVLRYLGVKDWDKSEYMEDCTKALEDAGWIIEMEDISGMPISSLKAFIRVHRLTSKAEYYMIHVPGHVLLLDKNGEVACDTAPRKRDKRYVCAVYQVIHKDRQKFSSNLSYEMEKLR